MQNNGQLFGFEFESVEDPHAMTQEEEADYWNGIGMLSIYVEQNADGVFEYEVLEATGCVGGIQEALGIDYLLTDIWGLTKEMYEGHTFVIRGISAYWTRGDGWETDDDVDYTFESIEIHFNPFTWAWQKAKNIWWRNIGWRLAK